MKKKKKRVTFNDDVEIRYIDNNSVKSITYISPTTNDNNKYEKIFMYVVAVLIIIIIILVI